MIYNFCLLLIFISKTTLRHATSISYTKANRVYLTFATFSDESQRAKSNTILPTNNLGISSSSRYPTFSISNTNSFDKKIEYFVDYVNNEYFILAGLIGVIVISPLLVIGLILKKFGSICLLKLCCRKKKKVLTIDKSDSALSGECGCIVRFRKNKNVQANSAKKLTEIVPVGARTVDKSEVLSKANTALKQCFFNKMGSTLPYSDTSNQLKTLKDKVRSMLLISANNDHWDNRKLRRSFGSISAENLLLIKTKACIDSEEDLDAYKEYSQKSLINLRQELLELDQLNQRLNFKI